MKRTAAISLLVLFLSANTIFGELLRLPVLVHHYWEHVAKDQNTAVLDFLASHYAKQINHPDDQHRDHENLPFKTIPSMLSLVFLPKVCIDIPVLAARLLPQIKTVNKPQPYTIAYLGSIWHPPCI
ncbi:hypothetical protein [Eisenibacter elegans]|uniref:hypothetical protein n=1 Tax=Eisenibacter elegans TaxID=997 RepID=UPI00040FBCEE|nr:hypothetical protein [Eisenibacter elegans]